MTRARDAWLLALLFAAGIAVLSLPYVLTLQDDRYRKAPIFYGSDETHYLVRLQEGLLRPFGNTSNGIFSLPVDAPGLQPGGLEQGTGLLFGWTGRTASQITILVSVLFAAAVLPLLALLLLRLGLRLSWAMAGSAFFFFTFLGPLRRFVHQSWSFPFSLIAILCVWRWWEKPTMVRAVIAGVMIGLLPYSYLWSWTFVWTAVALLCLTRFAVRGRGEGPSYSSILILAISAITVSLPYWVRMISLMGNPYARETAERSSVLFARGFESFPRSALALLLALLAVAAYRRIFKDHRLLPVIAIAVTPAIVLNQQFVHGQVISFATHYYPYLCLASLLCIGAVVARRAWHPVTGALCAVCAVFLGAAMLDYGGRLAVFAPMGSFAFQHLADIYPALDRMPRQTMLTDLQTALVVAANTKHDVVFTEHARHVLIPTQEYSERYCLSQLFAPDPHAEWVPNVLHEPSLLGQERQKTLHAERTTITNTACDWVRSHPADALKKYGISLVLWNQAVYPDWNMASPLITLLAEGEGWKLFSVVSAQ